MPFPKAWDGGQLTKGAFLSALLGERSDWNRTRTPYFNTGRVKNDPRAHGYIVTMNQFNDPWGNPYQIHLDIKDDGSLALTPAYWQIFGTKMPGRLIFVHSAGPDRDFATAEDNVTSLD